MLTRLRSFFCDTRGVTSIEYGMIAALIAVVIIVSLRQMNTSVTETYTKLDTAVSGAGN